MSKHRYSDVEFDSTKTSHASSNLLQTDELLCDRYRVIDVVGTGAMGTVYRAKDERLNIEVAIKALHKSRAGDTNALERFETELKLARQVSDANVVRIHDIGEHNNITFLTMDLVPGQSLAELIAKEGALAPERAAKIATDIAHGLTAAHANGVVHRDLKPANILLDNDEQALITDFGVARSMSSARLTRTGMFAGTPDYLAPEQAMGKNVDGRADIYALGLILYEMLSGKPSSNAGSIEELVAQRTLGRTPDLSANHFAAPNYLRQIIRRCLEKNPDNRYADAALLAADLSQQAATRRSPRWLKTAFLLVTGAALLVGVSIGVLNRQAPELAKTAVAVKTSAVTVAILPFLGEAADPALAWISTGLVESLVVELAATDQLNVVEKQRVLTTLTDLRISSGVPSDTVSQQLADLLGADWIIGGVIRTEADSIELDATMQSSNPTVPSRTLKKIRANLADLTTLGSDLANAVRDELAVPTPTSEPMRLSSNMAALRSYASGVNLLELGDSLGALEPLQLAVEQDNHFAAAWLKLGETYTALGRQKEAVQAIDRAVDESDTGNAPIGIQARIRQAEMAGNFEEAGKLLKGIVATRPGDGAARFMLAELAGDEGHYADAIKQLEALVEVDPNHPRAWFLLGKYSIQNGDSQGALNRYLVRALDIQNKLNNDQGKADVMNAMGVAQHRIGDLEKAQASYAQAASIRQKIGDQRGYAAALGNRARIELQLGQFDQARQSLDKAVEVRTELGDQAGLAGSYNIYGVLEEELGNYRAALSAFRKALKIRVDTGDRRALGNSYNNIGFAYFVLGEYDNASVYWQKAFDESIATENPDAKMQAEQNLGQLNLAQGNWGKSMELFLSSLDASRQSGFPDAEAVSLGNLGRVAQRQGRYGAAFSSYKDALTIVKDLNDPRGQIEFLLWQADAHIELGSYDSAQNVLERVTLLVDQLSSAEQLAALDTMRAKIFAIRGDNKASAEAFSNAIKAAGKTGSDLPMLQTMVAAAEYNPSADVSQFAELVNSVRDIGHIDLLANALILQVSIAQKNNDEAMMNSALRELLALVKTHSPYSQSWRAHLLASNVYEQTNNEAAQKYRDMARKDAVRLYNEIPKPEKKNFKQLVISKGIEFE